MKQFYIHQNDQQQGPFSLEDLKEKKITKETMIWFEGAEGWIPASQVEELKSLLKIIPPPLISPPLINKEIKMDIKSKQRTDNGKKKIIVFAIIIFVVGILISGGFYLYNSNQQDKLILEKQLKEQNAKINEQERIEAERIAEEERKQKAERLSALKSELDNTITKLRSENIALDKIKEFQFGRLSSERDAQIKSQLEKIRSLENKVESLKNAIEKY